MSPENTVVIVAAKRTPIGHFGGVFKDMPAPKLGGEAILSCLSSLPKLNIDETYMGCVLSAGLGQAPARQAALNANLPNTTPCTTINKMCGSGMKSVMLASNAILAGTADICIAGGLENMSQAPYLSPGARFGYRMGPQTVLDHMMHDGLTDAYHDKKSMGLIAEACAEKYKISRQQQDEFAISSIARAITATKKGFFKNEIAPITLKTKKGDTIIDEDEGISKAMPEKIPSLKPAFTASGTITAANASSISDGAAAMVLMRESIAKTHNITPLAKIIGHTTCAQSPEWFTTAPVTAIETLLTKIGWTIDQVDLFEINEAFAVVTLTAMQELNIPHNKVNVNGGACILGHPIGASGARILVTLIHALKQQNKKRGIAALCIGGGEATAIAIEV